MRWALPTIALMMGMVDATHSEIKDIQWRIGPNIPEFRKGGCATALGGKIISVFGMRQPWGEMETMYIYDPGAGLVVQRPGCPYWANLRARHNLRGRLLRGRRPYARRAPSLLPP